MNNVHQIRKIALWAAPFILVGIAFLFVYKDPLTLTNDLRSEGPEKIQVTPYDDTFQKGNSHASVVKQAKDALVYAYTLGSQNPYPYAGVRLVRTDSTFMDLSEYDHLRIRIKATQGTRIPVAIFCEIPHHTRTQEINSYYHLQYMLLVHDEWTDIDVPVNSYVVPNWWYRENKKTEKDFGAPDLSKVGTVMFGNCTNIKIGVQDQVEIGEITFYKDLNPFYIFSGIFVLLYFAVYKLIDSRKKTRVADKEIVSPKEISFQYEKLEAQAPLEKEEEIAFSFITTNYSQSELTIIDVQDATGIHERKLSAIIKNKTGLNFKQFLNKLRVTEAKRLLLETDLQISDIASRTGYSNASHFNRVFKSLENVSPNDFRKKKQ